MLIVVGTEDEYTPVSDAELMHELIPGSTLAVIEGAAHMPNLEREAESVFWAASQPAHVNINVIELMPVVQSFSPLQIHREQS